MALALLATAAALSLAACGDTGTSAGDEAAPQGVVAPAEAAPRHAAILDQIKLPPGFRIGVFAEVPRARSLSVADDGTVFVGQRRGGDIWSAKDTDGDGVADQVVRRARDLNMPNGIAVRDGALYVALNDRVVRWQLPAEATAALAIDDAETLFAGLPAKSHHGWRYAKFGPDGRLYVSIGSPCNICMPRGLEGTIISIDPDARAAGSDPRGTLVASGIRNSVGFDWHPDTEILYFTDNGADSMGDDIPADEFNKLTTVGEHFGFPWRGGAAVPLVGFENRTPPGPVTAPVIEFQAHVAALGVHFYDGGMLPEDYRHDAFVAQHGSWNRSVPVGYRVVRVRFDGAGEAVESEVFADGWLAPNGTLGRPVDIAELGDGSLLVSDDHAGLVYRIWYDPS